MHKLAEFPQHRGQRLRRSPALRRLMQETRVSVDDLLLPLFIHHGKGIKNPIASMAGHFQLSLDYLEEEIQDVMQLNIPGVILFGIPEHKDHLAQDTYSDDGIIQQAIRKIKTIAPELLVITDVCVCEYTEDSHCGLMVKRHGHTNIDNDATLELLCKQAVSHVRAGADLVAPSGMMDGAVAALRAALNQNDYPEIAIMGYSAKFYSAFYAPFRDISGDTTPKFGDRSSYQLDPANANEASYETALDVAEGADILMVKPALTYLDIIQRTKQQYPELPLAAYHVSGEYAMLTAAAAKGWIDFNKAAVEVVTAIKRAGADIIITYLAKDIARWGSQSY